MASPAIEAMVPNRPVLDVKVVAPLFDLNVKTLYAEIRAGRFPAIRLGRCIRIARSVVISMLEQGRAPPQADPPATSPSRRRRKG